MRRGGGFLGASVIFVLCPGVIGGKVLHLTRLLKVAEGEPGMVRITGEC
jgi:hypothetical protein